MEGQKKEVVKGEIEISIPVLSENKVVILLLVILVCLLCYAVIYYIQGYNELVVFHTNFVNETQQVCPFMFSKYDPLPMMQLQGVSGINTGGIG